MHEPDITMKCPLLKVYGPNFRRPSLMGCRFWDQRYAHPIGYQLDDRIQFIEFAYFS